MGNILFIAEYLALQCTSHALKHLAVIGIAPCDLEGHDLSLMVVVQVELEAKEPSHGGAVPLGQSFEHPVAADVCVVADRQLGAINKIDPTFLVFRPGDTFREPCDLGQDGFSGGDPCKGASLGIVVFYKTVDFADQFLDVGEGATSNRLLGNQSKPAFHATQRQPAVPPGWRFSSHQASWLLLAVPLR